MNVFDCTPLFDSKRFNILLELCEKNDFSIIEAVVTQFFEDLPPMLTRLADAVSAKDFSCAKNIAHSLRGSCATLGLLRAETAATELEKSAEAENAGEVVFWHENLRNTLPPSGETLRAYVRNFVEAPDDAE